METIISLYVNVSIDLSFDIIDKHWSLISVHTTLPK